MDLRNLVQWVRGCRGTTLRENDRAGGLTLVLSYSGRGVSSVVRRCVHRATGHEFAVKIMEVTAERLSPEQLEEVREATRRETHILRQVAGHPHISEAAFPAPVS